MSLLKPEGIRHVGWDHWSLYLGRGDLGRGDLGPGVLTACLVSPAAASDVAVWPPADPNQAQARTAFTTAWADRLRESRSFADVQKAAGAWGKLVIVDNTGEVPHAVYQWKGAKGRGQMRVLLYRTGDFGITVSPTDAKGDIQINNFGAYVCAACTPPVNASGRRPSWVSHAVHWDSSDCRCTLTGPQTLRAGSC